MEETEVLDCFDSVSFTNTPFTTMYFYTNVKPNLSNVVVFIMVLMEETRLEQYF